MTPLQLEFHQQHRRFHEAIARRAALVPQREDRSYIIPNTPFGIPKVHPAPRPKPPEAIIHRMWFEDLVAEALRHFRRPTVAEIIRYAALHFQIDRADLMRGGRTKELVLARHITMYAVQRITGMSLPEIGRRFGGFDHTSVLHGCRKVELLIERSEIVAAHMTAITNNFRNAGSA